MKRNDRNILKSGVFLLLMAASVALLVWLFSGRSNEPEYTGQFPRPAAPSAGPSNPINAVSTNH
jgi:hypothetical protein